MERTTLRDRAGWLVPLGVAVATFVAFIPALRAGFTSWDDGANFLQNLKYRGLGWTQLQWMWTTAHLGHYVPLSWMTLGLDYILWGMNPAGYHLVNLLLHAANAVMLYFIVRLLLRLAGPRDVSDPERAMLAARSPRCSSPSTRFGSNPSPGSRNAGTCCRSCST